MRGSSNYGGTELRHALNGMSEAFSIAAPESPVQKTLNGIRVPDSLRVVQFTATAFHRSGHSSFPRLRKQADPFPINRSNRFRCGHVHFGDVIDCIETDQRTNVGAKLGLNVG
jgi:hypothetical protein